MPTCTSCTRDFRRWSAEMESVAYHSSGLDHSGGSMFVRTHTRAERRAAAVAWVVIALGVIFGVCAWLTANGTLPAAPWSPIGQQQQVDQQWEQDRQTELNDLRDEQRERLYGTPSGEGV